MAQHSIDWGCGCGWWPMQAFTACPGSATGLSQNSRTWRKNTPVLWLYWLTQPTLLPSLPCVATLSQAPSEGGDSSRDRRWPTKEGPGQTCKEVMEAANMACQYPAREQQ
jgi:hypothetical protein